MTEAGRGSAGGARGVQQYFLTDDGTYPNNRALPVLIYRGAFASPEDGSLAAAIEAVFTRHTWGHGWRNGIFGFHHYHSTAHEALGCYRGWARAQLGGPEGPVVTIRQGDCIVLPAGTAHKGLDASTDFRVVGRYPDGQDFDMNEGKPGERPRADANIAQVSLPQADPVQGIEGPLARAWGLASAR